MSSAYLMLRKQRSIKKFVVKCVRILAIVVEVANYLVIGEQDLVTRIYTALKGSSKISILVIALVDLSL